VEGVAGRGVFDGVEEEVVEGLDEEERVAVEDGFEVLVGPGEVDVFGVERDGEAVAQAGAEGGEREGLALVGALAAFEGGDLEEGVDEVAEALGFAADVGEEVLVYFGGGLVFEDFGGAEDGADGAFEFVGEGLDVVFDVEFGGEVVFDAAQGLGDPVSGEDADEDEEEAGDEEPPEHFGAGLVEEGLEVADGFGEGDDAEYLSVAQERGGDVEDGAVVVLVVYAGGAGSVLPLEGEVDVAPLRVVGAYLGGIGGMEEDAALGVGEVDEGVAAGLEVVVDAGVEAAGGEFVESAAEFAGVEAGGEEGGEELGLVDHVFFDGFAVTDFEVSAYLPIREEGEGEDEESEDEDVAEAEGHF